MTDSRYTIEYINPDAEEKTEEKKNVVLFTFLGVIILAALAYSFFPINKSNQIVNAPQYTQEPTIEAVADDNATDNEQTPQSTTQLVANKKLSDSINNLTKQLMAGREKYKTSDKQLNSQKNENNQLSELLGNTPSKANKTDKSYLSVLNGLEENSKADETVITSRDNNNKQIDSHVTAIMTKEQNPNKVDNYNSISLSTNSKIDAIIAAMQSGATPPKTSANAIKTKEVQLASVSQINPTELLHIQLQRQIDQIINKDSTSANTNKTYNKALEKESKTRKNAVRTLTIRKGETLWSIAQRAYGNGSLYTKIIEANSQVNLEKLHLGQVIRVPK